MILQENSNSKKLFPYEKTEMSKNFMRAWVLINSDTKAKLLSLDDNKNYKSKNYRAQAEEYGDVIYVFMGGNELRVCYKYDIDGVKQYIAEVRYTNSEKTDFIKCHTPSGPGMKIASNEYFRLLDGVFHSKSIPQDLENNRYFMKQFSAEKAREMSKSLVDNYVKQKSFSDRVLDDIKLMKSKNKTA